MPNFTENIKKFGKIEFENIFTCNSYDDLTESSKMNNPNKVKMVVIHLLSAIFVVGSKIAVKQKSQQNFYGKDGELEC